MKIDSPNNELKDTKLQEKRKKNEKKEKTVLCNFRHVIMDIVFYQ